MGNAAVRTFPAQSFLRGVLGFSIYRGGEVDVLILDLSGLVPFLWRAFYDYWAGSAILHVAFTALEYVILRIENINRMTSTLEERAYTHPNGRGHRPGLVALRAMEQTGLGVSL